MTDTVITVPHVPFSVIARRIVAHWDPFEFNSHEAWLGMSRSGKSYAIRRGILPLAERSRKVVLDVKPGGERTWLGYGNEVSSLKPGFGTGPDGTPEYHMLVTSKDQVRRFLDMIGTEGSCVVVIDDSRRITANSPSFGLSEHVDQLLTIGAAIGITVIICANSTVWSTSSLRDQCGINWIGQIANEDERKRFLRNAGLPREILPTLGALPPRHFLYSDRYDGETRLAITHYEDT